MNLQVEAHLNVGRDQYFFFVCFCLFVCLFVLCVFSFDIVVGFLFWIHTIQRLLLKNVRFNQHFRIP